MQNLAYGVGVYTKGRFLGSLNRKPTKEYDLWRNMLKRCYSSHEHKRNPTYIGCSVSSLFTGFQGFAEWANDQIGFNNSGWNLDKDILVRGNRVYSEDNCLFIPTELNNLILVRANCRGSLPLGVQLDHGRYAARLSVGAGKRHHIGMYSTPEDAFYAYKTVKEDFIKERAREFKNVIDRRAYEALLSWEVSITD